MAGNTLHFMTNANVCLDGNSLLGRAKEIKLPEINVVQQEHQALGMIGKIQLPAGFDKLEGEIHWTCLYEKRSRCAPPIPLRRIHCNVAAVCNAITRHRVARMNCRWRCL